MKCYTLRSLDASSLTWCWRRFSCEIACLAVMDATVSAPRSRWMSLFFKHEAIFYNAGSKVITALRCHLGYSFGSPRQSSYLLCPGLLLGWFQTLKMEVIYSSETSVHIRTTWYHISKDSQEIWNNFSTKEQKTKTNSVALSPRANYTDWAATNCRRNLVPAFVDRGVSHGQRGGSPMVVYHSFLDRSRYFPFR
jgi:hypothetical protein